MRLGEAAFNYSVLKKHILAKVGYRNTTFVQGFYNESLPNLRAHLRSRMQPAMLVDLDCDLYESTIQAMEFLLAHRLLVQGTVVYFDDWRKSGEGMKKAHRELSRRHRIRWKVLPVYPGGRDTFLQQVLSVAG